MHTVSVTLHYQVCGIWVLTKRICYAMPRHIGHCMTAYTTSAVTLCSHTIYDSMLGQIHFLPGSPIS